MYLIDTNIFLEILLEQDKSEECEDFLTKISKSSQLFYVSSFTLHSIEVLMARSNKINELIDFLSDINLNKIIRLDTNTNDEVTALKNIKKFKLDFDDSLQYTLCERFNLEIVSFDKHFDKTPLKRVEPRGVKI